MRLWIFCIALMSVTLALKAQNSLAFYHLGEATFQGNYLNPSFVPKGKWFVGLPALSAIHVNYNNKFNYSDVFVRGQRETFINQETFLASLQRENMVSVSASAGLFHLAYKHGSGVTFSVYGNERVETDFLFPKSLVEFVVNGNAVLLDDVLKIGHTRLAASYFREIGMGLAIPVIKKHLIGGIHLKYLQGFLNASTPRDFTADIITNSTNYGVKLYMHHATLQSSGRNILKNKEEWLPLLMSTKNHGMALDAGFNWNVNRRNNLAVSLLDLGYIHWENDVENHTIGDTTMNYHGINLRDPDNLEQAFQDSLINKFKDKYRVNHHPYTTFLSSKLYSSWTYHLAASSDLIGTVGVRYLHGRTKWLFGAGYRYTAGRYLTGTMNVIRLPQQGFNLGAALATKAGPVQLYLAMDQLINFDITKMQVVDLRMGINFIMGARRVSGSGFNQKSNNKNAFSFLGSKVKIKGVDGIYTLIPRQKPRNPLEYATLVE